MPLTFSSFLRFIRAAGAMRRRGWCAVASCSRRGQPVDLDGVMQLARLVSARNAGQRCSDAWTQREPNGLHEESFGERPRVALGQCADFVQTLTLHWRPASVRSARVISRR